MKNENRAQAAVIAIVVIVIVVAAAAYYFLVMAPEKFVCDTCEEEFDTQEELDAHIVAEHPTPPAFVCDTCEAGFDTQEELNQHLFTAADHPEINITYWSWDCTTWIDIYENIFHADYPNIIMTFEEYESEDLYTKLATAVATGAGAPTICPIEIDRVGKFMPTGILLDLTDRMAPYVDDFAATSIAAVSYEGKIYAIPQDLGTCVLYYRQDILDNYGLTVPVTMDDLKAQGEALKAAQAAEGILPGDPEYIYYTELAAADEGAHTLMMLIQSLGGEFFRPEDGGCVSALDEPEALQAMEFMKEMGDAETAFTGGMWLDDGYALNQEGKIATTLCASWYGGGLKWWWLYPVEEGVDSGWRVAPYPQWEAGVPTSANWGGSQLCITTQTTELEQAAAWEYLKWCHLTVEGALKAVFSWGGEPAFLPTAESPEVSAGDPYNNYFGDQKVIAFIMEECAPDIPSLEYGYTEYFGLFMTHAQTAVEKVIITGEMTPEEALDEAKTLIDADIALGE